MIDPDEEHTVVAQRGRRTPEPGPAADEVDDATQLSARRAPADTGDEVDDATQIIVRRARAEPVDEVTRVSTPREPEFDDATRLTARRAPAEPVDDATVRVRQPTANGSAPTRPRDQDGTGTTPESDNSAVIARRVGRHDLPDEADGGGDRGLPATRAGDVPAPLGRVAQSPTAGRAAYPVRTIPPAAVRRVGPVRRTPQPFADTAAVESAQRRRRVRFAIATVVAACALLLAAIAALIVLVTGS